MPPAGLREWVSGDDYITGLINAAADIYMADPEAFKVLGKLHAHGQIYSLVTHVLVY